MPTSIHPDIDTQIVGNLQKVVLETSSFIKHHFGKVADSEIRLKDKNSLVSFVDIEAEKMLVAGLSQLIPGAGFITEEKTTDEPKGTLNWIIDPLDGTTNFLRGIPAFSISVALREDETTLLGVVCNVMHDECFHAVRDQGAFLNNRPIYVSQTQDFDLAMIATGFPYKKLEKHSEMFSVLTDVLATARGMRRLGSAAIDLAYTAAGVFDGYYEAKLNSWDLAAGILLVEEAGGRVSDFTGGKEMLNSGDIIAGNPKTYTRLLEIIRNRINE